ncbi:MAG: response regulator transcription factor [Bacteroidetes bacterium]|nr:response regulator transcription factor [Bacteroidota bacterium]MBU2585703.1 response regulator transcription factor [Bacteroidota bacterium]
MIKVLIADDHPIIRNGLKQILADENDISVVAEAENAQQVFAYLDKNKVDILVLDISMPGISGLEAMEIIHRTNPKLPILFLSARPEEQYGIRILKAGGAGYLHKESAPEELIKAIRKIVGGGRFISPKLAEQLAGGLDHINRKQLHESLSNREYELMCMIASGKTVSQIAEQLFLSVNTISTYRRRILNKMNMNTNSELTYYCIKNGLVQ